MHGASGERTAHPGNAQRIRGVRGVSQGTQRIRSILNGDPGGELLKRLEVGILPGPDELDGVVWVASKNMQVKMWHSQPTGSVVGLQDGDPRRLKGLFNRARDPLGSVH
jgi:hypothetical protein